VAGPELSLLSTKGNARAPIGRSGISPASGALALEGPACCYPAVDPEPSMLMDTVPPGRLGTEPAEGSPGMEPSPGTLGSDPNEPSPGMEPSPGTLGSDPAEGSPGMELAGGKLGRGLGAGVPEPPDDPVGVGAVDGTGGNEGAAGRLGSPEGPETQIVAPLLLETWTDPPPAGLEALPPPERAPGTGSDGADGVLTHCGPVGIPVGRLGTPGIEGNEGGAGSDDRPGTDERPGTDDRPGTEEAVNALSVAPLGKTLATAIATAATPAAPPASRTIRP
jgi:hypothetical protein